MTEHITDRQKRNWSKRSRDVQAKINKKYKRQMRINVEMEEVKAKRTRLAIRRAEVVALMATKDASGESNYLKYLSERSELDRNIEKINIKMSQLVNERDILKEYLDTHKRILTEERSAARRQANTFHGTNPNSDENIKNMEAGMKK